MLEKVDQWTTHLRNHNESVQGASGEAEMVAIRLEAIAIRLLLSRRPLLLGWGAERPLTKSFLFVLSFLMKPSFWDLFSFLPRLRETDRPKH